MKSDLNVVLAGNPNCGKSSLFNALTGLNQKIANYPGVTVDKRIGVTTLNGTQKNVKIIDLPGTYSLYPKSLDQSISLKVLCKSYPEILPDVVIVVVDASNLKRNLLLATQIIDLQMPVIIALNMNDAALKKGIEVDNCKLEHFLGVPIVKINARKKEGMDELKKMILNDQPSKKKYFGIEKISPELYTRICESGLCSNHSSYYGKYLQCYHYDLFSGIAGKNGELKEFAIKNKFFSENFQTKDTISRYKEIDKIVDACVIRNPSLKALTFTSKADKILTHGFYGYLILLGILFIVFQAIFTWSQFPMMAIESFFSFCNNAVNGLIPKGMLNDLIINGVLAGIGGIMIFIPQIALLFAFIAILEDTGYMSRASFLMDRMMRSVGLSGKSIIPLISGAACAVPAIMSARSIESWKERIITILVTPLMSCSARLPVYTLLIALAVPDEKILGIINIQGVILMCFYILGFIAAIGVAFVLKYLIQVKEKPYFILELPDYKTPRWTNIGLTIFEKLKIFIFDVGKVIICISILLWALASFSPGNAIQRVEQKYKTMDTEDPVIYSQMQSEKLELSYAGELGKFIEPVIQPLGFDWKIGIALIASFAAREVFVGTLATLYSVGSEDGGQKKIKERMMMEINPENGSKVFSTVTVFSLLIFYAFAMQCMSTLAVVKRETNGWKWPIIQLVYLTGLAYTSSYFVFNVFS